MRERSRTRMLSALGQCRVSTPAHRWCGSGKDYSDEPGSPCLICRARRPACYIPPPNPQAPRPEWSSSTFTHSSAMLGASRLTPRHACATVRASNIRVRQSRSTVRTSCSTLRGSNVQCLSAVFQLQTLERHGSRLAVDGLALGHDSRRSKISSGNSGAPRLGCRARVFHCETRPFEARTPRAKLHARLRIGGQPLKRHHRLQRLLQLIERVWLAKRRPLERKAVMVGDRVSGSEDHPQV